MLTRTNQPAHAIALPAPRVSIHIRVAASNDLRFIDDLQKMHTRMVGWMPTVQLEANIASGSVLIAEERGLEACGLRPELSAGPALPKPHASSLKPSPGSPGSPGSPVGYCLYKDRYFKRDDVGIIYQLNVVPGKQRGLIGASLIKAAFERSAYGVKLFCCWCAQDIAANHFWESIGFVPLAFRAGSRGQSAGGKRREGRIHIFWQRRIRAGDTETPYWYPSETTGGALRENRIVLPIPPGTHWSDAKPVLLPGMEREEREESKALEDEKRAPGARTRNVKKVATPAIKKTAAVVGGLRFATPVEPKAPKPKRENREKHPRKKNDPKYVAAARELRDRYLEQVNADRLLAAPGTHGKYDVSRRLAPGAAGADGAAGAAGNSRIAPLPDGELKHLPLLDAA